MEWNEVPKGYRIQFVHTGEWFKLASVTDDTVTSDDGREYRRDECRPIGDTGFIPFADPANTTDEGRALLAEIRDNEMEGANITSRAVYGRSVGELDLIRLRKIVAGVKYERRERERRQNPTPGTCWQCGCTVAAGGSECRPCHEGLTPAQYAREMRKVFITKPEPLPTWMK
jgi:hypothetical protein